MPGIGVLGLLVAFTFSVVSAVLLAVGHVLGGTASKRTSEGCVCSGVPELVTFAGRLSALVVFAALTVCCGVLVVCFFTGNMNIQYVLDNHSNSTGQLAWLFRLSGLWAGRQGSLLFWAWLISLFGALVSGRRLGKLDVLDNLSVCVISLVLIAFTGVLMFSADNMPFTIIDAKYVDSDGTLTTAASLLGMNTLLEHWAMAIHPPTLFVGYAGLVVPFAYAVAALVANDSSTEWVNRSTRFALVSWLFLTVGIGLGAVWAYVVLGWGGYWGWDPVENASLLPWLVSVALLHSFTVYRKRGAFKRWSIMCACLTFSFVIVGTFISRSGLVQSVHAFEGDPVSTALFLALIVIPLVVGGAGLALRWKSFEGPQSAQADDDSLFSKDVAYYINNLVLVLLAVLLAYLTISSALPSFFPFGGQSVSSGTYNAIARPIGLLYFAVLAVCPLLSWKKTDGAVFAKRALVPGICAAVLFVLLVVLWFTKLMPAYDAAVAAGGSAAEAVLVYGPAWYYHGVALVGLAVASVLFFNALFMLVRGVIVLKEKRELSLLRAVGTLLRTASPVCGGALAHMGMAVMLVGLVGSSLYVTDHSGYLAFDSEANTSSETFEVGEYSLVYRDNSVTQVNNDTMVVYQTEFDVYQGSTYVGHVSPAVKVVSSTQQQQLSASVVGLPLEDVFVIFRGLSSDGRLSMEVLINPLISLVWLGFALLAVGAVVSVAGKRKIAARPADQR